MENAPAVSLVIPCLNEEKTIASCVKLALSSFEALGINAEIVVADNGSTDGSAGLARQAGGRVVPVAERGYGAALRGGIEAARGIYVLMGDADGSYDFSAEGIRPYWHELQQGADLVIGNRFKGGIANGAMPLLNRLATPVMSMVVSIMFGRKIGDINCGMRGFRRDKILALGLQCSGMEYASEMMIRAVQAKLDIREVPTRLFADEAGRTPHLRPIRDGLRHVGIWLKLWLK